MSLITELQKFLGLSWHAAQHAGMGVGGPQAMLAAKLQSNGRISFAFVGDSITQGAMSSDGTNTSIWAYNFAANMQAMCPKIVIGNVMGLSGQTTDYINSQLPAFLASAPESVVFYFPGANDIQTKSASQIYASIMAGNALITASGKIPIHATVLPRSQSLSAYSNAARLALNSMLRADRDARKIILIDWDYIYEAANGTIPTSGALTFDGIHPYIMGAEKLATIALNTILPGWQTIPSLAGQIAPVGGTTTWLPNPNMAGTGGTKQAGTSGVVINNWYSQANGTGAAGVCSIVPADSNDPDPQSWQQMVLTGGTTDADGWFQGQLAAVTGVIRASIEIEVIAPDDSSLETFGARIISNSGSKSECMWLPANSSVFYSEGTRRRRLYLPALTITAGNAANTWFYVHICVAAGKTATLKWRRIYDETSTMPRLN